MQIQNEAKLVQLKVRMEARIAQFVSQIQNMFRNCKIFLVITVTIATKTWIEVQIATIVLRIKRSN